VGSRYSCAKSWAPGSRQSGLCRPSGAGSALPRAPSRHRLCREQSALCREDHALGRGADSGSETLIALQRFAQFCTHYTSSHISEICTAADNNPKIVGVTFLLLTDLTSPARLAFRSLATLCLVNHAPAPSRPARRRPSLSGTDIDLLAHPTAVPRQGQGRARGHGEGAGARRGVLPRPHRRQRSERGRQQQRGERESAAACCEGDGSSTARGGSGGSAARGEGARGSSPPLGIRVVDQNSEGGGGSKGGGGLIANVTF
jgi:hypothetical protein